MKDKNIYELFCAYLFPLPELELCGNIIFLHGERSMDEIQINIIQAQILQTLVQELWDGLVAKDGNFRHHKQILALQLA